MKDGLFLNASELAALCQVMNLPRIYLYQDPFRGWLYEEIEEAAADAVESLLNRQILQKEGEEVRIQPDLAEELALIAFPQMVIQLAGPADRGSQLPDSVYIRTEAWTYLQQEGGKYLLHGSEDFLELVKMITARVPVFQDSSRNQPVFHFPVCAVPLLREIWKDGWTDNKREELIDCGIPERSVQIMRHYIDGREVSSMMVQHLDSGQPDDAAGMVCVEHDGGSSMLILDAQNEKAVWQAWDSQQIRGWFLDILSQMLPAD